MFWGLVSRVIINYEYKTSANLQLLRMKIKILLKYCKNELFVIF